MRETDERETAQALHAGEHAASNTTAPIDVQSEQQSVVSVVSEAGSQSDVQSKAPNAASRITPADLRKLKRAELLEIMLAQSEEIDRLRAELDEKNRQLEQRAIAMQNAGSIAEASLALTHVFEEAQKAADLYVENVKRQADAGVSVGADVDGGVADVEAAVTTKEADADEIKTGSANGDSDDDWDDWEIDESDESDELEETDDSAHREVPKNTNALGIHAADAAREVREARYAHAAQQARQARETSGMREVREAHEDREGHQALEVRETPDARTTHDEADAYSASFSSQPLPVEDNPQQRKPGDGLKAIEDLIQDLKVSGAKHRG